MSDSIVSLRHVEKWYGNNAPAFNFDYKTNVFFQKDVGDALTIYDKYYQMLKVG